MNILIIGDSHAKGRLPDGTDSDLIADTLGCPSWCRLARSGSTARQWLDQSNPWLAEALATASRPETEAVFISLGGNDLFRDYADGVLTPQEAAAIVYDIRSILHLFSGGKRVFLLVYGDPYNGNSTESAAAVMGIEFAFRGLQLLVPGVTLVSESALLNHFDWCGKDIHPNSTGYIKIAEFVKQEMEAK